MSQKRCICKPDVIRNTVKEPEMQVIDIFKRLYWIRNPDSWKDGDDEIWADAAENVLVHLLTPSLPLIETAITHEKDRIEKLEKEKHTFSPLTEAQKQRAEHLFKAFKDGARLSTEDYSLLLRAGKL